MWLSHVAQVQIIQENYSILWFFLYSFLWRIIWKEIYRFLKYTWIIRLGKQIILHDQVKKVIMKSWNSEILMIHCRAHMCALRSSFLRFSHVPLEVPNNFNTVMGAVTVEPLRPSLSLKANMLGNQTQKTLLS